MCKECYDKKVVYIDQGWGVITAPCSNCQESKKSKMIELIVLDEFNKTSPKEN